MARELRIQRAFEILQKMREDRPQGEVQARSFMQDKRRNIKALSGVTNPDRKSIAKETKVNSGKTAVRHVGKRSYDVRAVNKKYLSELFPHMATYLYVPCDSGHFVNHFVYKVETPSYWRKLCSAMKARNAYRERTSNPKAGGSKKEEVEKTSTSDVASASDSKRSGVEKTTPSTKKSGAVAPSVPVGIEGETLSGSWSFTTDVVSKIASQVQQAIQADLTNLTRQLGAMSIILQNVSEVVKAGSGTAREPVSKAGHDTPRDPIGEPGSSVKTERTAPTIVQAPIKEEATTTPLVIPRLNIPDGQTCGYDYQGNKLWTEDLQAQWRKFIEPFVRQIDDPKKRSDDYRTRTLEDAKDEAIERYVTFIGVVYDDNEPKGLVRDLDFPFGILKFVYEWLAERFAKTFHAVPPPTTYQGRGAPLKQGETLPARGRGRGSHGPVLRYYQYDDGRD